MVPKSFIFDTLRTLWVPKCVQMSSWKPPCENLKFCVFFTTLSGSKLTLKSLSKWSGYFYLLMCFWAPATKMVPRGLPGPQKHPPRTTSERIPTQHPETSAEAHTELARAEFPILGGAAMTRRRRLQYKFPRKSAEKLFPNILAKAKACTVVKV